MKPRRPKSEKTRLVLSLELAVVLPAALLVVLSVLHLRSIQRDRQVEAAIQRDYLQFLTVSEKRLNARAYELIDAVKEDLPEPSKVCNPVLDRALLAHPYVAHIFVYSPQKGLLVRSQPRRMQEQGFVAESSDFQRMMNSWIASEYESDSAKLEKMQSHGARYTHFVNWAVRGDKHLLYQPSAMFLMKDKDVTALGGIAFDAEYIRDDFFPQMMATLVSHGETQSEKNPPVLMAHVRGDYTAFATSPGWDGGTPEVERTLEGAFPGMVLAVKMQGTTVAAIGQRFMRTSFITLGALTILLAGGIILTHRSVAKEVALARLKSDFVSNVSHELRTPLSLIRLYAETLEMGRITTPEKSQEYYKIIRKESERLTALINNILDFSRIEAGRKEYDFRDTDLQELVRNTLESYRYQIEQNGFTFEEKIEANVPPMKVDREAMARSLLNLVNNALKYSQDRKYIGVNLYRQNGSVKLEVVDHGIGIPPQEQQKIFEKFYRVGDPLVHNTKGSGLGLSLVRHIARAHGGEVAVDSEPGRGSRFIITLPVNPLASAERATA